MQSGVPDTFLFKINPCAAHSAHARCVRNITILAALTCLLNGRTAEKYIIPHAVPTKYFMSQGTQLKLIEDAKVARTTNAVVNPNAISTFGFCPSVLKPNCTQQHPSVNTCFASSWCIATLKLAPIIGREDAQHISAGQGLSAVLQKDVRPAGRRS
jgi:hypothetical protein